MRFWGAYVRDRSTYIDYVMKVRGVLLSFAVIIQLWGV